MNEGDKLSAIEKLNKFNAKNDQLVPDFHWPEGFLTSAQTALAEQLCSTALLNADVADLRGVAPQTIKNQMGELHKLFGVHTDTEFLVELVYCEYVKYIPPPASADF